MSFRKNLFLKTAIILNLFLFCIPGFCDSAFEGQTHCARDENTYFSCRIYGGDNIASICGKGTDEDGGINENTHLDYRYGPFGGRLFKYPRDAAPIASGKFLGEHMKPYGEAYESKVVIFRDMNAEYSVEMIDSFNPFVGVVKVVGRKVSQYACVDGTVTQSLLRLIQSLPPGAYK